MTEYSIVLTQPQQSNEIHLNSINTLENSSCLELCLNNILDFIQDRIKVLEVLATKLRYNGNIVLSGNDITEITRLFYIGGYSIPQVNKLLYSDNRQSIESIDTMIDMVKQVGLTVTRKQIDTNEYYIRATKIIDNSH